MEEDTLPSRKRARIKGASVELALGQGPDVKRDEEVWFTDGNVVLQAGGVAFKVYRGILALDSEVFSGMFSMPQPRAVETFQNCPVIHLTDDPDDVRQLLRVVFIDKRHVLRSQYNDVGWCSFCMSLASTDTIPSSRFPSLHP